MGRRILHADFNSFYASVACFLDPALRAHPVAVAGNPEARHGIILAKNELAKKFGVKTGEAIWQAKQKCPLLVTVKPDFASYQKFSALGRAVYGEYSDRVEAFGLDENWIDVTACTADMADAHRLAQVIRNRVREELGRTTRRTGHAACTYRFRKKDGGFVWSDSLSTLVRAEDGELALWLPDEAGRPLYSADRPVTRGMGDNGAELRVFVVPTLQLAPAEALDLLA